MRLLIATRNPHKLAEIRAMLEIPSLDLVAADEVRDLPEVEEDGDTFAENAAKKARQWCNASGLWTLGDDSGLEVDALGGAPGVYSARYAGRHGDDDANNRKLLAGLAGVKDRGAQFRCAIALAAPDGRSWTVEGLCRGRILAESHGVGGFGYDPLFVPEGNQLSFAEMTSEEKNRLSHRSRALTAARQAWGELLAMADLVAPLKVAEVGHGTGAPTLQPAPFLNVKSTCRLAGALWMLGSFVCTSENLSPDTLQRPAPTNLVFNGTFETADPDHSARPAGWDLPDGLGIQWTEAPAGTDGIDRGKAIRLETSISEREMVESWRKAGLGQWDIPKATDGPIAASYGLSYYSISIPAATNHPYRISFDIFAPGNGAKVWVRGYAPARDGTLRRSYETVVHCRPEPNRWHHEERIFHPANARADLREFRVMLYAYWPPGVYWFDNLRLEPLPPEDDTRPPPSSANPP